MLIPSDSEYKRHKRQLDRLDPETRARMRKQGKLYCLAYLLFFVGMMALAVWWGIAYGPSHTKTPAVSR